MLRHPRTSWKVNTPVLFRGMIKLLLLSPDLFRCHLQPGTRMSRLYRLSHVSSEVEVLLLSTTVS